MTNKAMVRADIVIGIDCGVKTGIAVYSLAKKKFDEVQTTQIHRAMNRINYYNLRYPMVLVRVEDARLRKWFGKMDEEQKKYGAAVREGVGAVKRDAKIWEDFLGDNGIDFELVPPANNATKLTAQAFKIRTGWHGITSEHSRDAGMLCYGHSGYKL